MPEPLPDRGAVELGGLVQLAGDAAEGGQVDQRGGAHVGPGGDQDQRDHREVLRLQPLLGRQVEDLQRVVEQARTRVVEPAPQEHGHHRRQHHRQVDRHPQVAAAVPQFVQHHRGGERRGEAEDQCQQGEPAGVPPRRQEQRVVDQPAEVVQPHPLRRLGEVDLLEAEQHAPHDRIPGEQREAEEAGRQEEVRDQVLPHPAAQPLGGGGRGGRRRGGLGLRGGAAVAAAGSGGAALRGTVCGEGFGRHGWLVFCSAWVLGGPARCRSGRPTARGGAVGLRADQVT